MSRKTTGRRPGWWYPWIFVGMFAVVVGVNAALAYFATSTFNGLDTQGAYEKGLSYNKALSGAAAQEKLGWVVDAEVRPAQGGSGHGGTVAVAVSDQTGAGLDGLDVFAVFTRPAQAGHDTRVALAGSGGGRYAGDVKLPFPGQWEVQVVANRGNDSYQLNQRVNLP